MGLMARMFAAIATLTIVTLCAFMAIGMIVGLHTYIIVGLSLFVVVLMWWGGPWVIRHIYKIDWVEINSLEPDIRDYIITVCNENKIKLPSIGFIQDNNPNAFCFGRTKNNAYLVFTKGIDVYCTPEEKKAVIAHEMGHIVHNDFVVMTTISAMPIIFYILYRSCFEASKQPGGDKGKGYIVMVGIVAWVAYVITQFVVLLVSRYREYWADRFSAQTTNNPNALSSALVKIAYGLASESKGEKTKGQLKYENALMISDPRSGRSLAFNITAFNAKDSYEPEDIKEAMAWDFWNPWAKWVELQSSHPLPAKRIMVMDKLAVDLGQKPYVNFDLAQPESFWDEFFGDVIVGYYWVLAFPLGFLVLWYIDIFAGFGIMASVLCFSLMLYLIYYRYPKGFKGFSNATVEYCIDDPKASPIRGIPVRLEGHIIGRGEPGLIFNEDLKIDDGTGIMLMDYHQVAKIIDLLEGIFKTEEKIGKRVVVTGWYRRIIIPYLELYTIEWNGYRKRMWTRPVYIGIAGFFGLFGLFFQLANPLAIGITLLTLLWYMLLLTGLRRKYIYWETKRQEMGLHPYRHFKSVADAAIIYNVIQFCDPIGGAAPSSKMLTQLKVRCNRCGKEQEIAFRGNQAIHRCVNCRVTGLVRI